MPAQSAAVLMPMESLQAVLYGPGTDRCHVWGTIRHQLVVGDTVYTVEDRGTPYGHIDIYMVNHEDAAAFGVQEAEVYLAK